MGLDMALGGFVGMVFGLQAVAMRDLGVMAGEMKLTLFMVLGGLAMVLSSLLMMFGSGLMMLGFAQSAHSRSPLEGGCCRTASLPRRNAGAVTPARRINELS